MLYDSLSSDIYLVIGVRTEFYTAEFVRIGLAAAALEMLSFTGLSFQYRVPSFQLYFEEAVVVLLRNFTTATPRLNIITIS